jgi:hypothetical protein
MADIRMSDYLKLHLSGGYFQLLVLGKIRVPFLGAGSLSVRDSAVSKASITPETEREFFRIVNIAKI